MPPTADHEAAGPRPPVGRVAHAILRFVELSETFIPDAILELERLGWEPRVITTFLKNRDVFPYPTDDQIRIAARPSRARVGANRLLGRNLPARQATWLQPAIASVAPDVVHAHFGHGAAAAAPAARRLGLPLVASLHGTDVTAWPGQERMSRLGYRWLFRDAACIVVPSRFLALKLRALDFDGRLEIVPAGIRLDHLPFTGPRPTPDDGAIRLTLVARQVPVKGTDVLLRALPVIVARHPTTLLDIIGYGAEAEANAALAHEMGVANRVRFLGGRSHADTLAVLRDTDVVVVCSRRAPNGDEESSCLVAREALAIGVPVVATRSGGIPDNFPAQWQDELVVPDDHQALALRICELLDRRDSWSARAHVGRQWIETEFDSRELARRTAQIYESVRVRSQAAGAR